MLPPDVPQYFFPVRTTGDPVYEAFAVGAASIHFTDTKRGIDEVRDLMFAAPITDDAVGCDWDSAELTEDTLADLEKTPEDGAQFAPMPSPAAQPKNYALWSKTFATWVFRTQCLDLFYSPSLKQNSQPGESERDFRIRLQQLAHEQRDELKAKLQAKYAPKLQALDERKRKAEQRKTVEAEQAQGQLLSTVVTAGAGLLGALLGRKTFSATNLGRATSTLRSAGKTAKERADIGRAEENIAAIDAQMQALNEQFEAEVAKFDTSLDPSTEIFETVSIKPKKTGITVRLVGLGWRA